MKFKKRSIFAGVAVLGSVLLLSGCGAHHKPSQSATNGPRTVKLGGPGIKKSDQGVFDQASSGNGVSSNDILNITKHHMKAQTGAIVSNKAVKMERNSLNRIPNQKKRNQAKAQFSIRLQNVEDQIKFLNKSRFDFYINKVTRGKKELILHGHFVKGHTDKALYARRGRQSTFAIRVGKNGKSVLLDPETKNKQTIISREEMTANGQSYVAKKISAKKAHQDLKSDKVTKSYINQFLN